MAAQNPHREGSFAFDHFARAQKNDPVGDYLARFEDGKARNTARQWLWNFPQVGQRARRGLTSPWSKTVKRSAPLRRGFFFVSALARLPTESGRVRGGLSPGLALGLCPRCSEDATHAPSLILHARLARRRLTRARLRPL